MLLPNAGTAGEQDKISFVFDGRDDPFMAIALGPSLPMP
jgi:hypothetical protein